MTARAVAGERPCGAWRWSDGGAGGEALGVQARDDLIAESAFASEQMRTTGDVEKQTIGGIKRNDGRKAFAPGGDIIERARVFVRIGFDGGELGMNGARIRKRHGEPQAKRRCARVEAGHQEGAGFLGVDRKGAPLRRLPGSDQPIGVQARQIDRKPYA